MRAETTESVFLFLQINLTTLMFKRGQGNHLCDFLTRKAQDAKQRQRLHTSDSSSAPSVNGRSRIPIMVIQRQKVIERMYSEEGYTSVDIPQYIWVEEGTCLTPAMVSESVYDSIYRSLTKPKHRDEFEHQMKECFEQQDLLSFGTTMNLFHDGVSFSEQRPFMVSFGFQACGSFALVTYFNRSAPPPV